ncbi:MAG: peptide chain release factor 3, partial [Oscillospiraceae bacterium]|nr:peptide chain release factor 3 [Oscillospiraceae bacterium]
PGVFAIGDTICEVGQTLRFSGIPTFAPEHFAVIEQIDSMKRKQFAKGMTEIAQEGAIQIFFYPNSGMEQVIVGVVGVLQYDVLKFRMKSEYGVEFRQRDLPHELIRRVQNPGFNASDFNLPSDVLWVRDVRGGDLLIFNGQWTVRWAEEKNEGLQLREFHEDIE